MLNVLLLALICSALAGVGGCQTADERDGAGKSNAAAEVGRPEEPVRLRLSLAADWRLLRQDTPEAADPEFDDSAWESVGVPHSLSHEDAFDELSKTATLAIRDDGKFYWSGVAWYRRNVAVPSGWDGRRLFVEFEGVSQRADVWFNGRELGTHFGSSAPFLVDITPHVRPGGKNTLAVRVDNTNEACRGVPGAMFWVSDRLGGIPREVWLHVTAPLYIPVNVYTFQNTWGTYVAATNFAGDGSVDVAVWTRVRNAASARRACALLTEVVDAAGRVCARLPEAAAMVDAGGETEVRQSLRLPKTARWSPSTPHLYRVVSSVLDDAGRVLDRVETAFGVRECRWDADKGFFLNGRHLMLRGYGVRQGTHGGILNALPAYLHHKDVRMIREGGGNFIRQGHSATAPAMMDACDRYGVFIAAASADCEVGWNSRQTDDPPRWWALKREFTRDIVVRDRNRPSVLLWEIGNGTLSEEDAKSLADIIREWDPLGGRGITAAANSIEKIPRGTIDVIGAHAGINETVRQGYKKPIFMMEYGWNRRFGFRGEWDGEIKRALLSVRDYMTRFATTNTWAGFTSWTFSESMGESHDNDGVCSKFGAVDANGRIPKQEYEALKTIWGDVPRVFALGHWNHPAGAVLTVQAVCHPAIRRAEARINGEVCGAAMDVPPDRVCAWNNISWRAGELTVTGWLEDGTNAVAHGLATAGPPARIRLEAEPARIDANGSDAFVVIATVVDADGRLCPLATNRLTFAVDGPGSYMGGFNHRIPGTHGKPDLLAQGGKIAVTVRGRTGEPGKIRVTASAGGIESGAVTVESEARTFSAAP